MSVEIRTTEADNIYIVNGKRVKVFGAQTESDVPLEHFENQCLREMVKDRRNGLKLSSTIKTERSNNA